MSLSSLLSTSRSYFPFSDPMSPLSSSVTHPSRPTARSKLLWCHMNDFPEALNEIAAL